MKITKLYILLLAGVAIFLTSTAYFVKDTGNSEKSVKTFAGTKVYDNSKIIKFNHKLHVKDAGVKCEDCHANAVKSVSGKDNLNPKETFCATCHDVKDQKNCNFCHVGTPKKLKSSGKELNFSHSFHIDTQKKACLDCHAGMDTVKYSKEAPGAFPPMETCYSCHNNNKATNNCEGCHTNLTKLTPVNHKQPNFLNEHKMVSDVSSDNNNPKCMMCHSDNFCQVCHSPLGYKGNNTSKDFNAPYYTKEGATKTDRAALQKLNNVHNLNYQFTHGLDANQKSFECKTCHETQTFCANCHQNGGDLVTGIAPLSHRQPNWTTFGVGTGGGLHSDLAKKDIEACQSCHDVQGSDPACVKCHFDNDGVKGTNPKTHESGFMKDESCTVWRSNQGAVCYSCHTDPNARPNGIKGVGFCGYCHSK